MGQNAPRRRPCPGVRWRRSGARLRRQQPDVSSQAGQTTWTGRTPQPRGAATGTVASIAAGLSLASATVVDGLLAQRPRARRATLYSHAWPPVRWDAQQDVMGCMDGLRQRQATCSGVSGLLDSRAITQASPHGTACPLPGHITSPHPPSPGLSLPHAVPHVGGEPIPRRLPILLSLRGLGTGCQHPPGVGQEGHGQWIQHGQAIVYIFGGVAQASGPVCHGKASRRAPDLCGAV